MNERDDMFGNDAERASEIPAWLFALRPPFEKDQSSRSWFGGLPVLPEEMGWPRDVEGRAMHFIIQIDLGALSEPKEVKLPTSGAMLVFVSFGKNEYRIIQLTGDEVRFARERATPEDLTGLKEVGFFIPKQTFHRWPLDLRYERDEGSFREEPEANTWINTWGVAAAEGKLVLAARARLKASLERYERSRSRRDEHAVPMKSFKAKDGEFYETMKTFGLPFFEKFEAFIATAQAMPENDPIDELLLADILERRRALANRIGNYDIKLALTPSFFRFENHLIRTYFDQNTGRFRDGVDSYVSPVLQGILSDMISGHRYHRLFGKPLLPSYETRDLRGFDCLFMTITDNLLGIQGEHECGFSIWCPRDEMTQGNFDNGIFIRHQAL